MKIKLLTICLLLITSKIFASDDLSGKNLFCEEHNLFVTYSFLDHKRYQTTNYFLIFFDIGIRQGTYGSLNNPRYIYLKADKELEIYNKLKKTDDEKNWKKKVVESPKLDYYLDRQDLNITFSPGKYSKIKSSCKLFAGTADELRESSLKKYLKSLDNNN
tara:strand:- start:156 stop:635 length:480 start_codon:yes stop_codon:yes gene_type:complete